MIFDRQTLLSDAQAITISAPSTNVIGLGPKVAGVVRDIGKGKPIPLLIQVVEAFAAAGAATLTVTLETDDNAGFASPQVVWTSPAIPKAALVPGYVIIPEFIPRGTNEEFLRVNYTVGTGPMTAGKIVAGVTMGNQSAPA